MVEFNPPAKRFRIGLRRETDSADDFPAGVEKFRGIEPIARLSSIVAKARLLQGKKN